MASAGSQQQDMDQAQHVHQQHAQQQQYPLHSNQQLHLLQHARNQHLLLQQQSYQLHWMADDRKGQQVELHAAWDELEQHGLRLHMPQLSSGPEAEQQLQQAQLQAQQAQHAQMQTQQLALLNQQQAKQVHNMSQQQQLMHQREAEQQHPSRHQVRGEDLSCKSFKVSCSRRGKHQMPATISSVSMVVRSWNRMHYLY